MSSNSVPFAHGCSSEWEKWKFTGGGDAIVVARSINSCPANVYWPSREKLARHG